LRTDVTLVDVNLGEESGFALDKGAFREAMTRLRVPVIPISTPRETDLADMLETRPR